MSEKEAKAVKLLDTKLDKKVIKTLTVCTVIMLIAILIHDGDHIRQAYNWGYTIPLSLWALNLTVYVLPVVCFLLGYFLSEGLAEGWRYGIAIAAAALAFVPSVVYDRYARRKELLTYHILRVF